MTVQPRTPYSSPTLAGGTYEVYTVDLTPEVDPTPAGYFWALQFGFSGGDGGYFGLQTLGTGLPGKCAVFSIADAISGSGTGIVTNEFDGDPGVSTRKTYDWVVGRTYRFTMTRGSDDGTGRLWTVNVTDLTTSTTTAVATIKVPSAWGALTNAPILFSEHYSPAVTACSQIRYSSVRWENLSATPLGGGTAATPSAWTLTYDNSSPCADAQSTLISAGVRQEMGTQEVGNRTTLTAEVWNSSNSSRVSLLPDSFDRRFQDVVSDVGSGSLSVLLTDPYVSNLTIGRHVRFLVDDEPVFTFRIDQREVRRVDQREQVQQVVRVSGRGIAADWADAVVYPRGGVTARPQSDVRPFTWCSPELSDVGWPNAVAQRDDAVLEQTIGSYADFTAWWPPLGWPAPVQSSTCRWVWSRAPTTTHPPGYSLFRTTVNVASSAVFLACVTGGGRARLFVDGIEVVGWTSSNPTWSNGETYRCVLPITAGSHVIGVEAENFDYSQTQYRNTPGSPGVVLAALHTLPATGGSFGTSTLVTGTSTSWKCLDYPATYPAPSPYSILNQLLSEAQARGSLTGWTFGGSISTTTDALGVPWAASRDVTPSVGDTYLSVLRSMVDLELIDFRADPVGRVLWVWNHGTSFAASGVTLTAGTNITELQHNAEVV